MTLVISSLYFVCGVLWYIVVMIQTRHNSIEEVLVSLDTLHFCPLRLHGIAGIGIGALSITFIGDDRPRRVHRLHLVHCLFLGVPGELLGHTPDHHPRSDPRLRK